MKVVKRDGTRVPFDKSKIVTAINKALEEVDGKIKEISTSTSIASDIYESFIYSKKEMGVEEIQDMVELKLMQSERPDVAKAYILYRDKRTKEREKKDRIIKTVIERNSASNIKNSNANVDEKSFSGREKEASSDIQKIIALDYTLSPEIGAAHKNMLLYQHDLEKTNLGVHNCLFLDFKELFSQEFVCRNGGVRPPQSIATAMSLVAVAFQCQSQTQFGGVGSVHIDLDLTPYVKKSFIKHYRDGLRYLLKWSTIKLQQEFDDYMIHFDYENKDITDAWFKQYAEAYEYAMDMLEREGQQAAEGLYHNLNTLESRAGSQVPFTSINTGRETTPEGRLITKWLMKASLNGIGSHHLTPIFPISIFQYKQGINANPEDPNYDLKQLALKSLSKRIYPNFVNCDWSEAHEDPENPDTRMSTMGK